MRRFMTSLSIFWPLFSTIKIGEHLTAVPVADLEGAEPAPPLPLWATDTNSVNYGTRDMWLWYCIIMATPSPVYLFEHLKRGTQNFHNDCHQWLSDSFRAHQIPFRPVLRAPDPLTELTALSQIP